MRCHHGRDVRCGEAGAKRHQLLHDLHLGGGGQETKAGAVIGTVPMAGRQGPLACELSA